MLTPEEIKLYLEEDAASQQKEQARIGQKYYDGQHDILEYRMFYWNADDAGKQAGWKYLSPLE